MKVRDQPDIACWYRPFPDRPSMDTDGIRSTPSKTRLGHECEVPTGSEIVWKSSAHSQIDAIDSTETLAGYRDSLL
jgi:hypothetical protein